MNPATYWLLLAWVALFSWTVRLVDGTETTNPSKFIPLRFKSEGRLTLMYDQNNKTVKHYLAFTEVVDTIELKSVISIGYISYSPSKYYVRKGSPTITISSDNSCNSIANGSVFVPEFSWFLDVLMPGIDILQFTPTNSHMIGPSGLLTLLIGITKDVKFERLSEQTVHRNIPCNVFTRNFRPPGKAFALKLDFYMPADNVQLRGPKTSYFSVKVAANYDDSVNKDGIENMNLIIDFFDIDSFENEPHKIDKMRDEFNFPLASGCSEFLEKIQPQIDAKSFSLEYRQKSNSDSILMAYDHASGFLRREKYGMSVSIWDLNEDLMYHIDLNVTNIIGRQVDFFANHITCSVIKVTDENLGPAYRPYDQIGQSLSVAKMIGATDVTYIGRGTVRDLPCSIYETILSEAPDLFALTSERVTNKSKSIERDYIVQFYLLRGDDFKTPIGLAPTLTEAAFWPAQIKLYRRDKATKIVSYLDQLDIYDFFWSLDGWSKKGNDLFMASECFDDEDEQLRLQLALTFDRVHHGAVKPEDKKLLPFNKYKLEFDLVNNVFDLLQTSKIHLAEYELRLMPHHVDLNMVVGDRKETKEMTYFGTGTLPDHRYYFRSQVMLTQMSEEDCVMASTLYIDVSMVVYCSPTKDSAGDSTCTMFTEVEPIVDSDSDPQKPVCQVYRFTPSAMPKRGTTSVYENKYKLIGHEIDFVAQLPEGGAKGEILKGFVKDCDVTHEMPLIVINHYMFALQDQEPDKGNEKRELLAKQNVRSFNSFTYSTLGDCIKICNLDVDCRSYSYCSNMKGLPDQCVLSSLDLRAAKLQDQLIHSLVQLSEGKTFDVLGDRSSNYTLKFMDHCDIYERDYLNMFRQTEEVVSLSRKLVNQFPTTSTTFECAKQSVDLERNSPNHHVAMFAYCPNTHICLLDENLFAAANDSSTSSPSRSDGVAQNDQFVSRCRVYRKKYQTYFNVSARVLARQPNQQIELAFDSVEECSRACWNRFGQVCASFDYCAPNSCLINHINMESSDAELETRSNCLHYERDLRLDELRRLNMIGRHELLQEKKEVRTFGGILLSFITYFSVFCAFVYGLVLGRRVNDKMEAVTILRQSISAGSGQRAPQISTFLAGMSNVTNDDASFDTMHDNSFSSNAIRLSVIKNGNGDDDEPLDQDF